VKKYAGGPCSNVLKDREITEEQRNSAAITIQKHFRTHKAKKIVNRARTEKLSKGKKNENA
jgi:hypothetical protein